MDDTTSGRCRAIHPSTKKVPRAPCRSSASSRTSMPRASQVGGASQAPRDTADSSALTWKYSSTSTVKKCEVVCECMRRGEARHAAPKLRYQAVRTSNANFVACPIRRALRAIPLCRKEKACATYVWPEIPGPPNEAHCCPSATSPQSWIGDHDREPGCHRVRDLVARTRCCRWLTFLPRLRVPRRRQCSPECLSVRSAWHRAHSLWIAGETRASRHVCFVGTDRDCTIDCDSRP